MNSQQLVTTSESSEPAVRNKIAGHHSPVFSLRSLVVTLYRYRWLIMGVILLISAATFAVVLLQPNKYASRMRILVRNTRTEARLTPEDTKGTYSQQDVSEADINTEVALVTSRDLLEELVKRTGLVEPAKDGEPQPTTAQIDGAVGKLERNLSVSPVKKSNIIEISYTAESPEQATKVVRELGALYLDKHLRLRNNTEGYELFKEQADRYNAELKGNENRLAEFEKANNLVAIAEQKQTALKGLADAESSFHQADAALGENEKRVAAIRSQIPNASSRVLTQRRTIPNQESVERLNTMVVELKNKRTQLLTKFRPNDRLVKEVDQQLKTTQDAIEAASKRNATEEATDLNPLRQKLETDLAVATTNAEAYRAPRSTYAGQAAQYRAVLQNLENATQQHEALQRMAKQSEENYLLYSRKAEEARITNAMDKEKISNVEIAEAATQSSSPSGPNRRMTLGLGLFLASFAGLCAAFAAEFMRDTVATPQELETLTGHPVLATLPRDRGRFYRSLAEDN